MKIYIIFLFITLTLSGCNTQEKPLSKNFSDSSAITSKSNNSKTIIIKPQKAHEAINEIQKLKNSNKHVPASSSKNKIKEINGFVLVSSLDKDIIIDLKYATNDNFTKKTIYPYNVCVLRINTAKKLVKANTQLEKLGYKIKVWDAYRPVYVQQIFWNIVKDSRFVANPKNGGSIHNKGCAVDVTLVKKNGNELIMPSKFDDFSSNAYRTNPNMTNEAKKNMDLLTKCMVDNGFTTIDTEWWHFEDADSKNYKIANINLKLFLEQN